MANKLWSWSVTMDDNGEPMSLVVGIRDSRQEVPEVVTELQLEADRENGTKIINIGSEKGVATGSLTGTGISLAAGERRTLFNIRPADVWMIATVAARLNILAIAPENA